MQTRRAWPDRRFASPGQLRTTRRHVLSCDGPGLAVAARHLGISPGYLSQLLRGGRSRRLTVGEVCRLRALRTSTGGSGQPAARGASPQS